MKRKILVVYYSRTGTTKKIAEIIARELNSDTEEIIDLTNRSGAIGWLKAGRDAMKENLTEIKEIKKNISNYNLIIIGSPNWGGAIAPGVRTFLMENKNKIKNIAFFCTMGGDNPGKLFLQMEKIIKIKPLGILSIMTKEVNSNNYQNKIRDFIKKIK